MYEAVATELECAVAELAAGPIAMRFLHLVEAKLALLTPHRDAWHAIAVAALDGRERAHIFGAGSAAVRERVQAAFSLVVTGASNAVRGAGAESLAKKLYAAHLIIVLVWLVDRSEGHKATTEMTQAIAGAVGYSKWLLPLASRTRVGRRIDTAIAALLSPEKGAAVDDDVAEDVLRLIFSHRRVHPGVPAKPSVEALRLHLPRVRTFLSRRTPIEIVLPAFPAKANNPHKVLGAEPDSAEVLAIRFLASLLDEVAALYPPGARLTICSDGHVFADTVGVTDASVARYREGLLALIALHAPGKQIDVFTLADAFGEPDPERARALLLEGYALTVGEVRARAGSSTAAGAQLDGIHRFLFEDDVARGIATSRNKARAAACDRGRASQRRVVARRGRLVPQCRAPVDPPAGRRLREDRHPSHSDARCLAHALARRRGLLERALSADAARRSGSPGRSCRRGRGSPDAHGNRRGVMSDATFTTREMAPFGLEVTVPVGTRFDDIDIGQVQSWLRTHRLIVLRGAVRLAKGEMPLAARRLGPLQVWEFGTVNELLEKPDTKNYLYTTHAVPLHWDGAFTPRVPHYLFFHCVEAPPDNAGGETIFVDTTRVWTKADAATRGRWRALTFRYATEKVVHYGGAFQAALVASHPTSGEVVLRFAEPVDDKNPVRVEAIGCRPLESATLIGEIAAACQDPDATLAHRWREGDIVLADNHALLHGRLPFLSGTSRKILRVNVHDERLSPWSWLASSIRIRRPEFMVAEIPILLLPLLLLPLDAVGRSATVLVPLIAAFVLLFHFGDLTNCYADRDLDAVYKPRLSEAVLSLGVSNVRWQIGVSAVLALVFAAQIALSIGRFDPLLLVVAGLLVGSQYSMRPLWLKGRGLWQIITLCTIIFVGPMLLVARTVSVDLPWPVLALFVAYAGMQEGIILVNTAEDLPEDVEAGIRTAAVSVGLVPCLALSLAMTTIGGGVISAFFVGRSLSAGYPPSFWLLAFLAGWSFTVLAIARTLREVRAAPDAIRIDVLRRRSKLVPLWITLTAWGTVAAAAMTP